MMTPSSNSRSSIKKSPLPSYKKPPVNEVVCGIRIRPMDSLLIPYYGLLWSKISEQFPIVKHAAPIGGPRGDLPLDVQTGVPLPRVWFINSSDDQLIQLQKDRFYFNWRKREREYPRYSYVISQFEAAFCIINALFTEQKLGELEPIEYELTYINHVLQGEGWNSPKDLNKVFKDFLWKHIANRFLPVPQKTSWLIEYALPDERGSLTVNLKYAIRVSDKKNLLVLELTARGKAESIKIEEMRTWFDLAHEWIVRGFTDITTAKIQTAQWERDDAGC